MITLRLTGAIFTLPTAEKLLSRLPAMQVGGLPHIYPIIMLYPALSLYYTLPYQHTL